MKLKKITLILIVILAVLVLIAAVATFTLDDSIIEEPKGNASVVVTGDVMFARNRVGVLGLEEALLTTGERGAGGGGLV